MTLAGLQVGLLHDHPDVLPTLTDWMYREWFRDLGFTRQGTHDEFCGRMRQGALPLSLVARVNGEWAGVASLVAEERPLEPTLAPFLSGVLVAPHFRRQGIGLALCRRAIVVARSLHLASLCLFALEAEPLYQRLGW